MDNLKGLNFGTNTHNKNKEIIFIIKNNNFGNPISCFLTDLKYICIYLCKINETIDVYVSYL